MTISGRYISALLRDSSSIVGFRSSSPSARVYSLKFPLTSKSRGSVRESTTLCDVSSKEGPTEIDFLKYKDSFGDLEISSSQWDKMEEMAARLFDWNSKINLVSRKDVDNLIPNHIVPCMTIAKVRKFRRGEKVIDIGTGGGLPGLPLAILCPDAEFTLLDSVGKKILVVEDISKALKLDNVRIVNDRAEAYAKKGNSFDFLTGRAVSNLPHFLTFSCDLLKNDSEAPNSGLLYVKGGHFLDEIDNAGIKKYSIREVQDMTNLESDKKILHIPALDVSFGSRRRKFFLTSQGKKRKYQRPF